MHCLPYHPVCGVPVQTASQVTGLSQQEILGWAYAIMILVFLVFPEWKPDKLTTAQQSDQQQTICMQGLL
jgi:hypothetical protein